MKKLYRIKDEAMIGGICAGVADLLKIDSTFVRLGFVFACVTTAFLPLIITYTVGYFIIPEKPFREPETTKKEE